MAADSGFWPSRPPPSIAMWTAGRSTKHIPIRCGCDCPTELRARARPRKHQSHRHRHTHTHRHTQWRPHGEQGTTLVIQRTSGLGRSKICATRVTASLAAGKTSDRCTQARSGDERPHHTRRCRKREGARDEVHNRFTVIDPDVPDKGNPGTMGRSKDAVTRAKMRQMVRFCGITRPPRLQRPVTGMDAMGGEAAPRDGGSVYRERVANRFLQASSGPCFRSRELQQRLRLQPLATPLGLTLAPRTP